MRNNLFITEFNKRFRNTGLDVSPVKNGKDFVISNEKVSKALLVRTEYPFDDKEQDYLRYPAPFYNAEAVVFFRFAVNDSVYPPDIIIFIYENQVLKRTDFLIFKATTLKECLGKIPVKPDKSGYYKLLLWIFPGDFVFVANNISGEGEWYLLGGLESKNDPASCMAKESERDLSGYLNRWDVF
jgi:hypothetical protein